MESRHGRSKLTIKEEKEKKVLFSYRLDDDPHFHFMNGKNNEEMDAKYEKDRISICLTFKRNNSEITIQTPTWNFIVQNNQNIYHGEKLLLQRREKPL